MLLFLWFPNDLPIDSPNDSPMKSIQFQIFIWFFIKFHYHHCFVSTVPLLLDSNCIHSKIKLSILTNYLLKSNWILTIRLLHSTSIAFFSIVFDLQVNWIWIDYQWFLFLFLLTRMLLDYHDVNNLSIIPIIHILK